jgi:hypothetical protein
MRGDVSPLDTPPEVVTTIRTLTNHRADLIADQVRLIIRTRDLLVGICPALEWAVDSPRPGGPGRIADRVSDLRRSRRIGVKRFTTWLERWKVRRAGHVAAKAVEGLPSPT